MASLTLRPNAAGSTMNWNAEGGDYTRVDEVTSDGDTTRLYTPTANNVATFNLENHSSETGTINSVTVYINTRGLDPISNSVQLAVRIGGTNYFSSTQTYNNTSYHNESAAWATNPNTSSAWTWTNIDDLEAGMKHISGGGQCVTQVWVVVDYTDNTTPTIALNTTDAADFGSDTTPTLEFTGTDTESDSVRYEVVINETDGFANGYSYRKKLTQDYTKVSGGANLTDIDVLYSVTDAALKTVANGGKVQHASGYDIRFETTGGTQLKHDVIFWSATTGQLITNIKIPTLTYASSTEIYMYYGKSGLSATEADEVNVYNSAYKGVWHMKEDPSGSAPQILDSTSNNYDMTSGGAMTSGDLVDGKVYKAIEFDGSNDELKNTAWSSVISGNGARTISSWFNIATTPSTNWISWGAAGSNQLSSMGCFGGSIGFLGYGNDNTVSGAPYDDSAWHKMSITHDGSTMKILINGTEVFSGSESLATSTGADLYFGRWSGGGYFPGKLCEIRISNSARTNGWEITQYNAENNNATFWTTGLEELGVEAVSAISGTDSGFANTVTGGDTDPFNSGEKVSFTVQAGDALSAGTYSWTARGKDPSGTDVWSAWATARTFDITPSTATTDLLDGKLIITSSATGLLDGKVSVKDAIAALLDGAISVSDSEEENLDGKIVIKDSASALLDGKIIIADDTENFFDGKIAIGSIASVLLDGKVIVESAKTDLLDGSVRVKDSSAGTLDGLLIVKDDETGLVDGVITIKDIATVNLDGRVDISATFGETGFLDGLMTIRDTTTGILDGKVILKDVGTALLDGLVSIKDAQTSIIDGRIVVLDKSVNSVDGKVIVRSELSTGFDGRIDVGSREAGLLDGRIVIKDIVTDIVDGKVTVATSFTDMLDGSVRIASGAVVGIDGKIIVEGVASPYSPICPPFSKKTAIFGVVNRYSKKTGIYSGIDSAYTSRH